MALRDILWEDVLVEPPQVEPLDLDEVKQQRRFPLESSSLDTRFEAWIAAARQHFEEETGLQLITAIRQCSLERFPVQPAITVGRAPVRTILSVSYLEGSVRHELDATQYEPFPQWATAEESPPTEHIFGPYATPGGIQLVNGASWPGSADRAGAVRIVYQAGFSDDPSGVPELLKYALLMYVGDMHRFAENQIEGTATIMPVGTTMVRRQASGLMRSARRLTRW